MHRGDAQRHLGTQPTCPDLLLGGDLLDRQTHEEPSDSEQEPHAPIGRMIMAVVQDHRSHGVDVLQDHRSHEEVRGRSTQHLERPRVAPEAPNVATNALG